MFDIFTPITNKGPIHSAHSCSIAWVVPHAVAISHGVAGDGSWKMPVRPASARADLTAYLAAKWADIPSAYDGSPVALDRRIPTGLGQSGSSVVCDTEVHQQMCINRRASTDVHQQTCINRRDEK